MISNSQVLGLHNITVSKSNTIYFGLDKNHLELNIKTDRITDSYGYAATDLQIEYAMNRLMEIYIEKDDDSRAMMLPYIKRIQKVLEDK